MTLSLRRMKDITLPKLIFPRKLASKNDKLQGLVAIENFKEATSIDSLQPVGNLLFVIKFYNDYFGNCVIDGYIEADCGFLCQRCLKPYKEEIKSKFLLSLVSNDREAKKLEEGYEPIIANADGSIYLYAVIEEELILSLPMFPKHNQLSECIDLEKFNKLEQADEKY